MTKIAYEPHPVSPERKQELRSQGFTIIDAVFAPREAEVQGTEPAAAADAQQGSEPRAGRKRRGSEPAEPADAA